MLALCDFFFFFVWENGPFYLSTYILLVLWVGEKKQCKWAVDWCKFIPLFFCLVVSSPFPLSLYIFYTHISIYVWRKKNIKGKNSRGEIYGKAKMWWRVEKGIKKEKFVTRLIFFFSNTNFLFEGRRENVCNISLWTLTCNVNFLLVVYNLLVLNKIA